MQYKIKVCAPSDPTKATSAVHVTATYRGQQRYTTSEETKMYVHLAEFMHLVFTRMPGESYRR